MGVDLVEVYGLLVGGGRHRGLAPVSAGNSPRAHLTALEDIGVLSLLQSAPGAF